MEAIQKVYIGCLYLMSLEVTIGSFNFSFLMVFLAFIMLCIFGNFIGRSFK